MDVIAKRILIFLDANNLNHQSKNWKIMIWKIRKFFQRDCYLFLLRKKQRIIIALYLILPHFQITVIDHKQQSRRKSVFPGICRTGMSRWMIFYCIQIIRFLIRNFFAVVQERPLTLLSHARCVAPLLEAQRAGETLG